MSAAGMTPDETVTQLRLPDMSEASTWPLDAATEPGSVRLYDVGALGADMPM